MAVSEAVQLLMSYTLLRMTQQSFPAKSRQERPGRCGSLFISVYLLLFCASSRPSELWLDLCSLHSPFWFDSWNSEIPVLWPWALLDYSHYLWYLPENGEEAGATLGGFLALGEYLETLPQYPLCESCPISFCRVISKSTFAVDENSQFPSRSWHSVLPKPGAISSVRSLIFCFRSPFSSGPYERFLCHSKWPIISLTETMTIAKILCVGAEKHLPMIPMCSILIISVISVNELK